jgi:hypothetical protein
MNGEDGTLFFVMCLPYPWPPHVECLLYGGEANGKHLELVVLTDGRLRLTIDSPERAFVSQPIDINSSKPRFDLIIMTWTASELTLEISGRPLLPDAPGISTLLLPVQVHVPDELSINASNAKSACQKWIDNRKLKFANPRSPRDNRRVKTTEEQGTDLRVSASRLRVLRQQTLAGNREMLGTLAGEMRASIYWPKGRETKPDNNWNPLLLRMANLAELPLPVFSVKRIPAPPILDAAVMRYLPADAPRINRQFATDAIFDLQESLINTVLRLGSSPGRLIDALDLIKELAHTMGAAHYDEDASEFLDFLHNMKSADGDQVTILMCHIAETLASLSEWVLSELNKRNLMA